MADVDPTIALVRELLATVRQLEVLHPGRKFTLDGHVVGSLGEVTAESMFDILLEPASNAGYDAHTADGKRIEIKATFGKSSVAVRPTSETNATHLIALRFDPDDVTLETVYNGPLYPVHKTPLRYASNGQARVSLTRLRGLNEAVSDVDRVPKRTAGLNRARRPGAPS